MPFFMIKTYIKERAPKPSTLMVMGLQKPGVKPQRPTSCHDLHYSTWCVVLCVRTRIPVELGIKLLKASMEISEEISYWNLSLKTISLSLTSPWSWSNVIHPWWSDLCLQAIHCSLPSPPRIQPAFQRHCSELKHDEEKKKEKKRNPPKVIQAGYKLAHLPGIWLSCLGVRELLLTLAQTPGSLLLSSLAILTSFPGWRHLDCSQLFDLAMLSLGKAY